MRKLTFNGVPEDRAAFKVLYFGFLQGGANLTKERKDRSTVRLEARIAGKFDAVMETDPTDQSLPWRLKEGDQVLRFTPEEYQHVDACLDAVPWPTGAAKQAAAMFDFWGDAEKE